ncbi:putative disulfide bond reductase yfcG [Glarea lozoyensis 74030]|nr:putative disulfide bond reductase yfcG [Glarea lozoyensis 74030]
MCEELREHYDFDFTWTLLDTRTNDQKKDWFLRLNPNGKVPVIVDNTKSPPFPVFETAAELLYLLKEHDKDDVFGFKDEYERSECLQWLFFWHGGGGPIQGQMTFFGTKLKQKEEFATQRFKTEVLRTYNVIEIQLSGKYTGQEKKYLAGKGEGKYSVADIGAWPWVSGWGHSGLISKEEMDAYPHLLQWIDRIRERPAVQKGSDKKYMFQGPIS